MANEKRLIDANALELELERTKRISKAHNMSFTVNHVVSCIKNAPTVDAVEVVHARWEEIGVADYKCSRCGFRFTSADPISMFRYCRCGAKMDGDANTEIVTVRGNVCEECVHRDEPAFCAMWINKGLCSGGERREGE